MSEPADAWKVFRILAEFVDGFEKMSTLPPSVCVFGSSSSPPSDPMYLQGMEIAQQLVTKGFGIITGGGGGIMEAANRGAREAGGSSCGICIDFPIREQPNAFIDPQYHLCIRYFFVRKVLFMRYAQAFIFMPGGYGTLDELFETLTLIQTQKIRKIPLFLFGSQYWNDLLSWLVNTACKEGKIAEKDLQLLMITDHIEEMVETISQHHHKTQQSTTFDLNA